MVANRAPGAFRPTAKNCRQACVCLHQVRPSRQPKKVALQSPMAAALIGLFYPLATTPQDGENSFSPCLPLSQRKSTRPMKFRSTTILTIRHNGKVAMGGDGQVSMGDTVVKSDALKIRRLMDDRVLVGFAGAAADAFALMERLEAKLKDYPANLPRAATELAKDWRTDRAMRRLEALVAVVNDEHTFLVSGTGDVIQPSDGILGIGSGGNYAVAAARALVAHSSLSAAEIVRQSLEIAADICVYTNHNLNIEEL